MEDFNTAKEINLKNIKKVLTELSINLGYDLEPAKELINIKHSHLNGISYPIFKECLFEWLEKQEKFLSTTIFVEDNNLSPNEHFQEGEGFQNKNMKSNNLEHEQFTFGPEYNLNMIILQRSLYILKRKFEIYDKEIYEIYKKYMETNKMEYIIDISKFISVVDDILKETKFSFAEIKKPQELFRVEVVNNIHRDKIKKIVSSLEKFMIKNRRKYNNIMKDKKEKGFLKLNENSYRENRENEEEQRIGEDYLMEHRNLSKKAENKNNNEKSNEEDDILNLVQKKNENIENNNSDNEEKAINKDKKKKDSSPVSNSHTQPVNKKSEGKVQNENINNSSQNTNPDELHPNEILNTNTKEKNDNNFEENEKIRKMKKTLEDDIRSFIMDDKDRNYSKMKLKNQPIPTSDLTNDEIALLKSQTNEEDSEFKEVMEKLKNRKMNKNYQENDNFIKIEFLLIEILPLIIADFVHENSGIVVLDSNEELKFELRTLFDNEILQRLGEIVKYDIDEEKTIKLKELLFEKLNLDKNIRTYEDLFLKKQIAKENSVFIEQMLKKLKKQKDMIENKIKTLQEDNETTNNFADNYLTHEIKNNSINVNIMTENSNNNDVVKNPNQNISHNNNTSKLLSIDESSLYRRNNVSKIIPRKYLTKEELRSIALKEIFHFYSQQHQINGHLVTFDDIAHKFNHMDLGEFNKFCVEFKILVKKDRLIEVFKKSAGNTRQMTFEEFVSALRSISVKVNDEKKELVMRRMNRMKRELKKFGNLLGKKNSSESLTPRNLKDRFMNNFNKSEDEGNNNENNENSEGENPIRNEDKIEENNNNNSQIVNINKPEENNNENSENLSPENNNEGSPVTSSNNKAALINKPVFKPKFVKQVSLIFSGPEQILNEIPKLKSMLQELKNKSYQQLLEELFLYLDIDNEKVYRSKMKGFVLPFFYSYDKNKSQSPKKDLLSTKKKKLDPRTAEEIKRILKERKEEKEREAKEKERLEKLKVFDHRKKITQMNNNTINNNNPIHHNSYEQMMKDREKANAEKENKYTTIKQKKEIYEKEKESKLTWDQLENLNSNYFITNREDDFNPNDLIEEELLDSDDEELFVNLNIQQGHEIKKSKNYNTENISNYSNAALINHSNNNLGNSSNKDHPKNKNLNNQNHVKNKSLISTSAEKIDKSIDYSITTVKTKNTGTILRTKSNSPNSKNRHDHSYFMDKTEKKAKELEKEWEEKQVKLIQKYDNMIKKSQEKVRKIKNK